jgi:hypothetical protein
LRTSGRFDSERRHEQTCAVHHLARRLGPGRMHLPLRLLLFGGHSWIRILLVVLVIVLLVLIARNRR